MSNVLSWNICNNGCLLPSPCFALFVVSQEYNTFPSFSHKIMLVTDCALSTHEQARQKFRFSLVDLTHFRDELLLMQ